MKSVKILNGIVGLLVFMLLQACTPATPSPIPATPTPQPTPTKAWTGALAMFRGSPNHTGVYDSPPIHKLDGVKWKFKAEGPISASAALAGGWVYFGSQDGNLYALDSESGAEKWRFHTEKPIHSSAAISNGLVYFQGNDGFTYALDAQSGQQKWKTDTGPDRATDYDYLSSSPAIADNIVYIAGGNGSLYALKADTGEIVWSVSASEYKPIRSSPAIVDGTVYFTTPSNLLALDGKTGKQKWSYRSNTETRSSPTVGDGIIVFGDNSSVIYAVDQKTGVEKWKYRIKYYWIASTAAISNGVVYIGGDDSYLNALDAQTGAVKWRFKTQGESIWPSPALVGDVLYISDWNFNSTKDEDGNKLWGYLYALDTQTGQELWNFKTANSIVSSPVVDAGGVLYFGSLDGYFYALSGKE